MKYDKNYQYDVIGKTSYYTSNENQIFYQNTFTATDNEFLSAISTYFEKTSSWDVTIYVNDEIKLTQSGISDAGYYTIRLNERIPLNIDDSFKIVFKVYGDGYFRVPVSEKAFTNKFLSHEGISFFSYDGKNWFDLYTALSPSVASIKAFTSLTKLNTNIELNIGENQSNPVLIEATVFDEYQNIVKSGSVIFTIENTQYLVEIVNGSASIYHKFSNGGLNSVTASFSTILYNNNSITMGFNVDIKNTSLKGSDLTTYVGSSKYYSVKLLDENNKAVTGKDIIFTVNGVKYIKKTNNNGVVILDMKLKVGKYVVVVSFEGDNDCSASKSISNKITVKSTLSASDKIIKKGKTLKFKVKLVSTNGKALKGKTITFKIKNSKYKAKTNKKGFATISVNNLKVGKYKIVSNYGSVKIFNKVTVKK